MKLKHVILMMAAALVLLPSCSSSDSNDDDGGDVKPYGGKTFVSVDAAPDWIAQSQAIPTSQFMPQGSETIIFAFKADFADVTTQPDDIAAVFVNGQCRSAANPIDGKFYLSVAKLQSEEDSSVTFRIQYYSSALKGYFVSQDMTMEPDKSLGTLESPFCPVWK
jgi:hypothetical protein